MENAVVYTRVSYHVGLSHDQQREDILAKFGDTYRIVGEYRDGDSNEVKGQPGLQAMLKSAAKGEFDVLLCTDLTRLTRHSPEILAALNRAGGVRVVTADRGEIGIAYLVGNSGCE